MSNLGAYQAITTASKVVGGPENLVVLIGTAGYAIGKGIEVGCKKAAPYVMQKLGIAYKESTEIYTIANEVTCEYGLILHPGDEIRIMESDGDAVQIEVIGDINSPYFLSLETLKAALGEDIEL